ncbi:RBPJ-interacting and tubulin-associated protein 1 isoform X1 [Apus apus]|uniref:RBPJ-interacting and tubulin-associated protein 1 isoform X1 n=1 Tax=Apus apus TaxID=8895 RepID=UPI0021F8B6ED|nr:RBPJ-interacting and tubulin-associated protein 1 isoform X1 [Apus apus]
MRAAPGSAPPALPGGTRGSRRLRRARASFVDESLFGSPGGARPPPPAFPPPWAVAPAGCGPRPGSKSRMTSPAPSFCDESLFGAAGPARGGKEDVSKLQPLLWSPPPAPRDRPSGTPRGAAEPGREGTSCGGQRSRSQGGSRGRGSPGRGPSQPLSRVSTPSEGLCLASERCQARSPAAPRGPARRDRLKSVSGAPPGRSPQAVGGCNPRPPWK